MPYGSHVFKDANVTIDNVRLTGFDKGDDGLVVWTPDDEDQTTVSKSADDPNANTFNVKLKSAGVLSLRIKSSAEASILKLTALMKSEATFAVEVIRQNGATVVACDDGNATIAGPPEESIGEEVDTKEWIILIKNYTN